MRKAARRRECAGLWIFPAAGQAQKRAMAALRRSGDSVNDLIFAGNPGSRFAVCSLTGGEQNAQRIVIADGAKLRKIVGGYWNSVDGAPDGKTLFLSVFRGNAGSCGL